MYMSMCYYSPCVHVELCGVKLDPYMCLMLELAPKQSLRVMLKRYKEHRVFLEPLTIKNTVLQVHTS